MAYLQTPFHASSSFSGTHSEGGGDSNHLHRRRRRQDCPQQPPPRSALRTKKKAEVVEVGDGYGRHGQEEPRQDTLLCSVSNASNVPSESLQHRQEEEEEDHHHQQQQDRPQQPAPSMRRTKKKREAVEVGDRYVRHGQEEPGPDALPSSVSNASCTPSESLRHRQEEEKEEEDHCHHLQDHPQQPPHSVLRTKKKRESMAVGSGHGRHEQEEPRLDTLLSNASNIPSESLQHHQEEEAIQCFPPPTGYEHHRRHRLDHPEQPPPSMLRMEKRREVAEVGDGYGQHAGQEVRSFGILHWGGGKRPRGTPPKHLDQSRIQTRSQHAATLPDSLQQALSAEKKKALLCHAALDPCTPSPEDSSSRLLMRDGQDDATVLSSHIPLNQATEFRQITMGRDQLISSCPRKHSNSLENDSHLILESASQHSTMTVLQMRREEISLRPRPTIDTFDLDSFEWPRIVITLSRKEKEDDFLIMKRSKLPQRPKRRTKATERAIRYCYLGNGLSNITRRRYEVREKKPIQKKSGGLKAMESEESDSNS